MQVRLPLLAIELSGWLTSSGLVLVENQLGAIRPLADEDHFAEREADLPKKVVGPACQVVEVGIV